jgi:hypothetical protein
MQEYDRSSKWLIEHYGDSILRLGGVRGILSWKALQTDLVQTRRLPDGLIEAKLRGRARPTRFVLEVSTYPYRRLSKQAVRGSALVFLARGELPEVLTLILHPGGRAPPTGIVDLASPHGWTRWHVEWKVVELWTIPAADLLAANDLGLIPWVPLARIDGPPEPIFQECRKRIDRDAQRGQRENLLAVTQFLAKLNYNDPRLFQILGGRKAMIESPMVKELIADSKLAASRSILVNVLVGRFGPSARDLRSILDTITEQRRLEELARVSGTCPDLESFKKLLPPGPRKRR